MKQPGKRTQLFVMEETSFGVQPTLAATHAIRHIAASLDYDPFNRAFSPEKKAGPGRFARFNRRATAGGSLEGLLRPSGTLNTVPECSPILKAAFGSVVNTTLDTTVNDASAAATGATLTSVTGLVVGSPILITCPDGKKRARFVTGISTNDVTWAPALQSGQEPANGAAVKCGIAYPLTSGLAISLAMARYTFEADFTAGLPELLEGWGLDRLSLTFPNVDEPKFSASGPAQQKADAGSHPGGFTQVGGNPPSALAGEAQIDATLVPGVMQLAFELTNGLELRNDEVGAAAGTSLFRIGDRDISCSLDVTGENEYKAALYDKAMAGTDVAVFEQIGFTEGNIIAVYAPRVEFKVPTVDVPDDAVKWPIRGVALESVEDAGGELLVAFL